MKPTKGEIRLMLDLVPFYYPLYKDADKKSKAILAKDIFHLPDTVEELTNIASFKKILFKKKIKGMKNIANGKPQILTQRVLRHKH